MADKRCKKCTLTQPREGFYRKKRWAKYPDSDAGYSDQCKKCDLADRRTHRLENREKVNKIDTNSRFKRSYGITLADYEKMFISQQGRCPGCNRHQDELKFKLAVDHCHKTGKVRGLLCITCNLVLGYVFDKVNVLQNLINYLSPELAANNTNVLPLAVEKEEGYLYR